MYRDDLRKPLELGLFVLVPLLVTVWTLTNAPLTAVDFHDAYWSAGWRLIHHLGVYAGHVDQSASGGGFTYPPLCALVFVPFALIARTPSSVLYTLVCLGSAVGTLWVLRVRDWRLYGLLLTISPVVAAWNTGNLTLPLCLGLALLWRHRAQPLVAGCLTAVLISLKLFVWPFGLWLVATRRYRASLCALAAGVALNLMAWAIVGFNEFSAFVHRSGSLTHSQYRQSYGVLSLASRLGAGYRTGEVVEVALSLGCAGLCWLVSRREERAGLALCALLALVASPLVWSHYFALLLVPFAIAYPTLGWVWLLPLCFCVGPVANPTGWESAIEWVCAVAAVLVVVPGAGRHWSSRVPALAAVSRTTAPLRFRNGAQAGSRR
jgi:alpha-1,2-mannosyltransferase